MKLNGVLAVVIQILLNLTCSAQYFCDVTNGKWQLISIEGQINSEYAFESYTYGYCDYFNKISDHILHNGSNEIYRVTNKNIRKYDLSKVFIAKYFDVRPVSENVLSIHADDKSYLFNTKSNKFITLNDVKGVYSDTGLILVKKNDDWLVLDEKFQLHHKLEFEEALFGFMGSRFGIVRKQNSYKVLAGNGNLGYELPDLDYRYASDDGCLIAYDPSIGGYKMVKLNNTVYKVLGKKFDYLSEPNDVVTKYFLIKDRKHWGVVGDDGDYIVPPKYQFVSYPCENRLLVQIDNKFYLYDIQSKERIRDLRHLIGWKLRILPNSDLILGVKENSKAYISPLGEIIYQVPNQ